MIVTVTIPDDWATVTDLPRYRQELSAALGTISAALARATVLSETARQVENLNGAFLDARDGTPPATGTPVAGWPPYRAPTGAHDAYPEGRVIRWNSRLFKAVRDGVAHNPTEAPREWTDVTDLLTGVTPPTPPVASRGEWDPTATYKLGDTVTYQGALYMCAIGHGPEQQGQWKPGAAHTVWTLII